MDYGDFAMSDENRLQTVQKAIKYTFREPELLLRALRHSSYINEHAMTYMDCNERLEFLGDAVLEIAVSWILYDSYPDLPEGKLTKLRAGMVCELSLAKSARNLGLGDWLQMGKGEEKTGGRNKDSLLADAMEALIGAIFLDGGSFAVNEFIKHAIISEFHEEDVFHDWKTELQEHLQQHGKVEIRYSTEESDEDSPDEAYLSNVYVGERCIGSGTGRSKKSAQQAAAYIALQEYKG